MEDRIKIVRVEKIGAGPPPPPKDTRKQSTPSHHNKQPKHGVLKGGKTARAKIHAVRDPAKSPPLRKATLKILTEKGAEKRRKRIHKTVRAMHSDKVRTVLKASGYSLSKNTPDDVARQILAGGMEAGMIVSG